MYLLKNLRFPFLICFAFAFTPELILAQEIPLVSPSGASSETSFIFNTLLFLFCGALVMFMSCGFAMLEAGMVRYKNVGVIILKNIALYAIAGFMFYLIGYNLMYADVNGGFFGTLKIWSADDSAALGGNFANTPYAASADWFFQMVFVATTASIISGAVAERMKIWTFLTFTVFMTGFIYPITGSWKWGKGWLDALGFMDFAGSTLVHSVGGWAALVAIILTGSRTGRFDEEGKPKTILPSNIVAVCLGTFILWFGWFGFNGGSQLSMGTGSDAIAIANIFVNTNIAACAGVLSAMIVTALTRKKIDIYLSLNGALGGLVSITAEPLMPTIAQAALIGVIGGIIVVVSSPLLEKLRLDDVVGAIPVHLCCGIWGTLIVAWTNPDATLLNQLTGIVAVGLFTIIASVAVWFLLKITIGLRVPSFYEIKGLDEQELGVQGMPYITWRKL